MPSGGVVEVSLAVIAVAIAVGTIFLVPALIDVRRAAARAAHTFEVLDAALPTLLTELTEAAGTLNRTADTVGSLAASIERLERVSRAAARVLGVTLEVLGQTTRVALPSLANVAGVLSAVREGIEWVRPRRDRRRDST